MGTEVQNLAVRKYERTVGQVSAQREEKNVWETVGQVSTQRGEKNVWENGGMGECKVRGWERVWGGGEDKKRWYRVGIFFYRNGQCKRFPRSAI